MVRPRPEEVSSLGWCVIPLGRPVREGWVQFAFLKGLLGYLLSEALCWVLGRAEGYGGAGWQQALPVGGPLHPSAWPRLRDPERGEEVGALGSRSPQNTSGKTWRHSGIWG